MQNVLIIGGGESGVGAALLAKHKNYNVFLTDNGWLKDEHKNELRDNNIPFEEGGHNIDKIESFGFDVIVKSPGVPNHAAIFGMLNIKDRDIISEIEFGSIHYSEKILAITGSNGKTTTSGLLFNLLKTAGLVAVLGGNYGKSFCRILTEENPDYAVLEISSFQLDNIKSFKPYISILLNITPDHLDRYDYKMEKYVEAKFKITSNQSKSDIFIVNADDENISQILKSRSFGANLIKIKDSDYLNGIKRQEKDQFFDLPLIGRHNALNAYCAIQAARILGLSDEIIQKGLSSFVNDPHRLEEVCIINGVKFINDSKATNVDSVFYALDAMKSNVIWIAGGTDKGNDYDPLAKLAKEKVKALICLGVDNEKLKTYFKPLVNKIIETKDVEIAVSEAFKIANDGDVVLLSPACASFDLFKNYIDRGEKYKDAVWQLTK
jgi:UDP-N-acetylmuramoylalanine--D-glutamate ligase